MKAWTHRYWRWLIPAWCFIALSVIDPIAVYAENPNDILIVVNKAVPVNSLTIKELKNIFLKKQTFWSSAGGDVIAINAKAGSFLQIEFLKRGLGMTEAEETEYWRTSQIQSGISKPVELSNTLKAVFSLKRAVSYVLRSDYKKGVCKIVLILPSNPSN